LIAKRAGVDWQAHGDAFGVRVRAPGRRDWLACAAIGSIALTSPALRSGEAVADVYTEPTLALQIDGKLVVGERVTVSASGTAPPDLAVWAYVDPQGEKCRFAASAQPTRAIAIASAVAAGEQFSVGGEYQPHRPGQDSICAYLGPSAGSPIVTATARRKILPALLPAAIARRTVPIALRRHGFAERVVDALHTRCQRRGRAEFRCRFSAHFQGYDLAGPGRDRRADDHVYYRFEVRAQGIEFVLTERNEGHLPSRRR
jgi:hypothetical protein